MKFQKVQIEKSSSLKMSSFSFKQWITCKKLGYIAFLSASEIHRAIFGKYLDGRLSIGAKCSGKDQNQKEGYIGMHN